MPQQILKSSSKFEMGSILTWEQFRCRNCSKSSTISTTNFLTSFKVNNFDNKISQPLKISQFFTFFLLTISKLVLFVCLSCLVYSFFRVGTFSCLFHSLVRVGRFFLSKLVTVNNFDKKSNI